MPQVFSLLNSFLGFSYHSSTPRKSTSIIIEYQTISESKAILKLVNTALTNYNQVKHPFSRAQGQSSIGAQYAQEPHY